LSESLADAVSSAWLALLVVSSTAVVEFASDSTTVWSVLLSPQAPASIEMASAAAMVEQMVRGVVFMVSSKWLVVVVLMPTTALLDTNVEKRL
jgi:hypothetical protein